MSNNTYIKRNKLEQFDVSSKFTVAYFYTKNEWIEHKWIDKIYTEIKFFGDKIGAINYIKDHYGNKYVPKYDIDKIPTGQWLQVF